MSVTKQRPCVDWTHGAEVNYGYNYGAEVNYGYNYVASGDGNDVFANK